MDRQTVYLGQLARSLDVLLSGQNAMVALAKLAETVLGTSTLVDGFTCVPTTPASLNVLLTAGQVYQIENLEATNWSAVNADTAHSILKQGIMLDPATLGITPPATVGYSQCFLIEVQYADLDAGSIVLPYYNAAAPSIPFSGPANAGTAQNTVRKGIVAYQVKAGIAAATGTQVAPTADAGWTGLFLVTLANGATTITSGNITQFASAPFLRTYGKLPQIPNGVQSGLWLFGTDTGSANAMVASLSPAVTSLTPGMTVRIKKGSSANTSTVTLDVGLGANGVKRANGADLQSGDLPAGTMAELVWDGSFWQIANFQGFNATTTTVNNYTLTIPYCADTSVTPNTITAPFSPALTSLSAGDLLKVKCANSNTGPTTITINSLPAKAVNRKDGTPLLPGDIFAGEVMELVYDGTAFQVDVNSLLAFQYDLASPPGSAVALRPGQYGLITFSNRTTMPLNVALAPGRYSVDVAITNNTSTNTDFVLQPNNTTYTGAFESWVVEAGDDAGGVQLNSAQVIDASAANAFYFDMYDGPFGTDTTRDLGPCLVTLEISTFTAAKMVRHVGGVAGGGAVGFSRWNDTTTSWANLGTLILSNLASNCSGVVTVKRLS